MIVNDVEATIHSKIVYVGPAMSGKTTTLKVLSEYYREKVSNDFLSIENTSGRTLYFDYLLIFFKNRRYSLKTHIYSTTGQDFYAITRPDTIRNLDGIVFVADSSKQALIRNIASWKELEIYLGQGLITIPKVIVFNKQDLEEKFDKNLFCTAIKVNKYRNIEIMDSIAIEKEGVVPTFRKILKLILESSDSLKPAENITQNKSILT
jgi:signal recognition particle receptor subunit beta